MFGKQYQYRTADQRWTLVGSEMSVCFGRLDSKDKVVLEVQWKWDQVDSRGKKRKRRLERMLEGRVMILSDIVIRTPELYSHVDVLVRGSVGVSMHVTRTNEISPVGNQEPRPIGSNSRSKPAVAPKIMCVVRAKYERGTLAGGARTLLLGCLDKAAAGRLGQSNGSCHGAAQGLAHSCLLLLK